MAGERMETMPRSQPTHKLRVVGSDAASPGPEAEQPYSSSFLLDIGPRRVRICHWTPADVRQVPPAARPDLYEAEQGPLAFYSFEELSS